MSATPTVLSKAEKKRLFDSQKFDEYQNLSQSPSLMWNFFLSNNHLFKKISPEDGRTYIILSAQMENKKSTFFFGSIFAIFLVDRVAFKYLLPNFRINRFRFLLNFFKYFVVPAIGTGLYSEYGLEKQTDILFEIQQKYGFGFDDYMDAMKMLEKHLEKDDLEEFIETKNQRRYDWLLAKEPEKQKL